MEDKYMEWITDYLEEDDIVIVKILIPLKIERLKSLCQQISSLARECESHKYLIDLRGVANVMSVLDLDKVPEIIRDLYDPKGKIALLLDPPALNSTVYKFIKNVLFLASMQIKLFSDRDEAIAWLKSV
jgi:hypothetical protein